MKPNSLIIFLITTAFVLSVSAQRKPAKHMEHMMMINNADKDNDFKIDSSDIRDWVEAVSDMYNHQRPMMRMKMPALEYAEKFDKNMDSELSSSEERTMRDHFKKAVAEAQKTLFEEYDLNKNRRFDDKELPKLRSEIHNLTNYAIELSMGIKQEEEKPELKKEPRFGELRDLDKEPDVEPVKKRKFDDIYD